MKYDRLRGKRVVVVGGTSGIGFAVAEGSLYSGASWVLVASSSQAKVDGALQRLPKDLGKVEGKVFNAAGEEAEIKAFFDSIPEFDHLVWTAGGLPPRPFTSNAAIGALFARNTFGPLHASKYVPNKMPRSAESSITLTIGANARKPVPGMAVPTAAVGSCQKLGLALALDLKPIRVNVVAVGLVMTEFHDYMPKEQLQVLADRYAKTSPVEHVAVAEEVAETYLYAMKATNITGETLFSDGGRGLV